MQAGELPMYVRASLMVVIAAVCRLSCADEVVQPTNNAERLLEQTGSLTLRDTTLSQALFTISETWRINLLFGKNIEGHVNAVFRNASLREVLDSVLLANGYGYQPKGQSLIIMPLAELGDSNAMLKTVSIDLPPNGGDDIVEAAGLLLSSQGKIQAMTSIGRLMVRDYPENITKVQTLLQNLGSKTMPAAPQADGTVKVLTPQLASPFTIERTIAYFSPRYTQATSLREPMETFLDPGSKIVVVETENRIAVIGTAADLKMARAIFEELDQPREQVRITALIYDVNTQELEKLGVNWTHNVKAGIDSTGVARQVFGGKFGASPDPAAGAFTIGETIVDAAAASTGTLGAARLTTLNRYFDLDTIINALDQTDGARLLADPSVTVLDREEASIKIVTEIPIQQLTQTSEGGSIGTTSFREAGVTLTVTPQIGGDGTITMEVTPTFSVLTGFSEGQPIIDSREASTKVRIANGQTLVLGGLRQRSETETVTGIPGLMRWKRLGKLFRDHSTTIQESELIVFLRPEITMPNSSGTEREMAAMCTTEQGLEKLNWPNQLPVVPDCKDPHCPYHHPRSRYVNPAEFNHTPVNEFTGPPAETTLPPFDNEEFEATPMPQVPVDRTEPVPEIDSEFPGAARQSADPDERFSQFLTAPSSSQRSIQQVSHSNKPSTPKGPGKPTERTKPDSYYRIYKSPKRPVWLQFAR